MTDVRPEDVERLAVLVRDLADIRRSVRVTAASPPGRVPELLAHNINDLSTYIADAARLGAELSAEHRHSAANYGEMWGQEFAATRGAAIQVRLTEQLGGAYDLQNQLRPRTAMRPRFVNSQLAAQQQERFAEIDAAFGSVLGVLRKTRSGLRAVMLREQQRARDAEAPAASSARAAAARLSPHPPIVVSAQPTTATSTASPATTALSR
ncbi:hypothetical protein ABZW30_08165 [Kitasatospora sp. NPDC004669]|uniref:hypothetical protein n=1 Tax=Kitasatospora sp. NPDC004669 TaxID=3154555 RepID=UPI00339ECDAA